MENRILAFDTIRTLAIIFVVFIHTMEPINEVISSGNADYSLVVMKACMNIIYTGVPLFVMLSGALLLGKEENTKTFFSKRISRVLMPFVVWSIIVYLLFEWKNGGDVSLIALLEKFFFKFFTNGVYSVYWYIYMLLGLYLLTPVLRIYYQHCSERMAYYLPIFFLVVYYIGTFLPAMNIFSRYMSTNMIYLFYFTAGYTVKKYLIHKCNFNLMAIGGGIYLLGIGLELIEVTSMPTCPLLSLSLFCIVLSYNERICQHATFVRYISKISYGIYLSHFIIISIFCKLGLNHSISLYLEPFVMVFLVMIIECVMMYVIGKTKLMKFLM